MANVTQAPPISKPNGAVALTQVQKLAKYAARASFDDLSAESLTQLPVHILDCLACCISALGAAPVNACREQVADFEGTGPGELIRGEIKDAVRSLASIHVTDLMALLTRIKTP
jgi:hypothetical protein